MGVLIFTRDATPYREGHFVEGEGVVCSPACEDMTLIVHEKRPKKDDCLAWLPYVSYRMVYVCDKAPDLKDHPSVIFDKSMSQRRDDYMPHIQGMLRWRDRNRAWAMAKNVPMPLMLAFLRENNKDIGLWRLLAQGFTWTPDEYQMAAVCFSHHPSGRMKWPKKKTEEEEILPYGFRASDSYAEMIASADHKVGNDIRTKAKETMPKSAKKKKQGVVEWL